MNNKKKAQAYYLLELMCIVSFCQFYVHAVVEHPAEPMTVSYEIDELHDTVEDELHRLEKHIKILGRFNTTIKNRFQGYGQFKEHIAFNNIDVKLFKHELIILCLKKMLRYKSISPVIEVWEIFLQSFKMVDSEQFIKDLAVLVFCIYTNLLTEFEHIKGGSVHKVTLVDVFVLYGKVSLIPIRELLNLLDLCYVRFEFLLKEYGFFSSMNWQEWLEKYWWVPPVIILSVTYNIFYQQYVEGQSFGSVYLLE